MENKLTIKEQILKVQEEKKIKAAQKAKAKEEKILLEAKKAKERAQQKIVNAARKIERDKLMVAYRDCVFDNYCKTMRECTGLSISIKFKTPKYLKQFSVEGIVKFSKKNMTDQDDVNPNNYRIASLKVRNKVIAKLMVNVDRFSHRNPKKCVHVNLYTYNPRGLILLEYHVEGYKARDIISYNFSKEEMINFDKKLIDIPAIFQKYDCSDLQKSLVRFFSKIVTDIGTNKQIKTKVKPKVKSNKKKKEEAVAPEFKFINLK